MPENAASQASQWIPAGDWVYMYVKRLQQRGHLLDLNPTALPYSRGELAAALATVDTMDLSDIEKRWFRMLTGENRLGTGTGEDILLNIDFDAALSASGSTRLDPLRPIEKADTQIQVGDLHLFPRLFPRISISRGRFIGQLGLHHNVYFDEDPDGVDAVTRLYVRSEEAYAGYQGSLFSAYLGRFGHLWAPPGESSTLLSHNARSFDQLYLKLGGPKLAVRGILGELDSITRDGRYTGQAGADSVTMGSERRYLALHRIDWRPSKYVTLSAMESVLYSGSETGVSLKYLNPFHALSFVVDERPKNEENNGLLAGLIWAQYRRLTLHGQLVIDDFDLMGETSEPASIAMISSISLAGITPQIDAGVRLELVTSRAYNTHQPEGRYLYLLRGIATQFSDYVLISPELTFYADRYLTGLSVTPRIDLLWQGERSINQAYPEGDEDVELVLTGTEEHTFRPALEVFYQPSPFFWVRFNFGPNFVQNSGHVAGTNVTRFSGQLDFGIRVRLHTAL